MSKMRRFHGARISSAFVRFLRVPRKSSGLGSNAEDLRKTGAQCPKKGKKVPSPAFADISRSCRKCGRIKKGKGKEVWSGGGIYFKLIFRICGVCMVFFLLRQMIITLTNWHFYCKKSENFLNQPKTANIFGLWSQKKFTAHRNLREPDFLSLATLTAQPQSVFFTF